MRITSTVAQPRLRVPTIYGLRQDGTVETWDAIRARRNVRAYTDRPLSNEDLMRTLEAGRRAPSSRNWQPWDFIVVTDRQQLAGLSTVWRHAGHVARSAATIALIAALQPDPESSEVLHYDLGQATMSMALAAADLGIGSGHASVGDQRRAREILGYPSDRFCAYLLALGHPSDRPLRPIADPDRRPLAEMVHHGRW
jgi:nitroreductase